MKLKPPQVVVLSFAVVVALGTILLKIPAATSTRESLPFIDALFTATSATCVTGLTVRDTGVFFSRFGQTVIMLLFQAGGLGIMTLSTLFAVLLGRKLTIKENLVIQSALGHHRIEGIKSLIKYIFLVTFGLEVTGAALLFLWARFDLFGSIFHAVSGFCNAGFSLQKNSFADFAGVVSVNLIMTTLIILGGLGFIVLLELPKFKLWKKNRLFLLRKISLQTKVVLLVTVILICLGAFLIFFFEKNNTLAAFSLKKSILASYFQAVTPRTAGFNTLPIGRLAAPTLFLMIILMFIGASPGSTGGGIKTATLGILLVAFWSMFKNRPHVSVFGRTIPKTIVNKVFTIFFFGLAWIVVFTMLLAVVEGGNTGGESNSFLRILFEVTSAFGTVGLSMGITPYLTNLGKMLIILTMFLGRVGPLTVVLAIALEEQKVVYKYPEEQLMVG